MNQHSSRGRTVAAVALGVLLAGLLPGCAALSRASETATGVQANADSAYPALSEDGRWVAFLSLSNNLVPGDTNQIEDIFVRDNWTKAVSRVSVSSAGAQAVGPNSFSNPSISDDGRVVAFASRTENLTANDDNGEVDVFWHDRDTDSDGNYDEPGAIATVLASATPNGSVGNGLSAEPVLNSDGSVLAFASRASDLVAAPDQDTNAAPDVFASTFDLSTAQRTDTRIVSRQPGAPTVEATGGSSTPSIDGSGTVIAFQTDADNLLPGDTNNVRDVAVNNGSQILRGTGTQQANGSNGAAAISRDATRVAYVSSATNLVAGDTEGNLEVFVTDLAGTGLTVPARQNWSGTYAGHGASYVPSISADGSRVAYTSWDPGLVPGDTNNQPDVFVHDFISGVTQRVSTDVVLQQGALGTESGSARPNALSADGRFIAFSTRANLLSPDANAHLHDLYVRVAMVPVIGSVVAIDPVTQAEILPRLYSGTQQLLIRGKAFGPSVVVGLGAGVTASVTASTATGILVEAEVAPDAAAGPRNVIVQNRGTVGALANGTFQICSACITVAN